MRAQVKVQNTESEIQNQKIKIKTAKLMKKQPANP